MLSFFVELLVVVVGICSASRAQPQTHTYYVNSGNASWPQQLTIKACVGLMNRDASTPAYDLADGDSQIWLQLIHNMKNPILTPIDAFVALCLKSNVVQHRFIKFDAIGQQALLPIITTLAGVLSAVPFDVGGGLLPPTTATSLAFDATDTFNGFAPIDATRYVYQKYLNETTGMAKLNPGYESQEGKAIFDPKITGAPALGLVDYIVYAKLFNLYLTQGCLPLSKEHELFKEIVAESTWPRPIRVMGYDNTFVVAGGDFFEAETLCDLDVGMGQIASAGTPNLAYWTRGKRVDTPLPVNPTRKTKYNSSKTYIAFVIGDGDNIDYIKGTRRRWIDERVTQCNSVSGCSYPLLWTMSPHVLYLAPEWARWYANQLLVTERDRFALPPSGDLYAYPELFSGKEQELFVKNTEEDARILSTSVTTDWEWATRWADALETFFPKYAKAGIITSLVTVNTPYNVPTLAFGKKFYKLCGDGNKTVVFKPHEWRGTRGSKIPWANRENLNVSAMAKEINGYAPGTVTAIYLTSDGGGNLGDIRSLVNVLEEHVEVVGNNIGEMAMAAAAAASMKEPVTEIYTVLDLAAWQNASTSGWYDGGSEARKSGGVIHCASGSEMLFVLHNFFNASENVSIARIDPSKVKPPAHVVYVKTEPELPPFPHIEGGPLATSAVDAVSKIYRRPLNKPWRKETICKNTIVNCTEA
jgi:uncharacterized protein (DUF952 family)